tara:strand:+ start:754 stop:1770 length:1017 start_codon:yes stop_codon:yes gene_type:complete
MPSSNITQEIPMWRVFLIMGVGLSAIGFSPVLVRFASDSSPFLLAVVRTLTSFIVLLPVFFLYRRNKTKGAIESLKVPKRVNQKQFWWMALAGISLGLHLIAWITSIYFTSIASASVLVTIHPILIILVERIAFRYRFQWTIWVGVFIAFIGSIILGLSDQAAEGMYPNPILGNALAVLAAIIFAVYFLVGNRIRQESSWIEYVVPVYGWAAAAALVVLFALYGVAHWGVLNAYDSILLKGIIRPVNGESLSLVELLSPSLLWVGVALALGPQIIGHGSLNYVVKFVSPTLLSTLILFEPVLSSIIAFFLFGEVPLLWSLVGMGVIFLGILLTWAKKS